MRTSTDRGQVTILIIGFSVVVMLLIAVVISASTVFLQRRSLMSWADGAALSAAQGVEEESIYTGPVGDALPLSQTRVRHSVTSYVSRHRLANRYERFKVASVEVDSRRQTVTVIFQAVVPLPFGGALGPAWADGQPIRAVSRATAPLSP